MCQPCFRYENEPTPHLRATLRQLVATHGDQRLIDGIRLVLTSRALGLVREDGWPTALDDPKDDGLPDWSN